ncbi:type II CRISPR-associated endonuclease Cas1 [Sulfurimonas sp.]
MGFKVVHLTRPCKISIESANLHIKFYDDESEVQLTLRDIDTLVFDNDKFSITGKTLHYLAKHGIATLFIDESYHPSSILIPYHQHSTMSEVAHAQISLAEAFKADAWQKIIKAKIVNQANVLEYLNIEGNRELYDLSYGVLSYDSNQDEAQAARIYWKALFRMETFRREQGSEDIINVMLNYGYAIIRASIAREVSASGMLSVFGIWHKNRYNAFALVDDLMEPFRPICDLYVKLLLNKKYYGANNLSVNIKRDLVGLLNKECVRINNGTSTLTTAITLFVREYKKAMLIQSTKNLYFPGIETLEFEDEFF